MAKSKSDFYNSKITNSKSLYKVVDTLVHRKSSVLLSCAPKQPLADDKTEVCHFTPPPLSPIGYTRLIGIGTPVFTLGVST